VALVVLYIVTIVFSLVLLVLLYCYCSFIGKIGVLILLYCNCSIGNIGIIMLAFLPVSQNQCRTICAKFDEEIGKWERFRTHEDRAIIDFHHCKHTQHITLFVAMLLLVNVFCFFCFFLRCMVCCWCCVCSVLCCVLCIVYCICVQS